MPARSLIAAGATAGFGGGWDQGVDRARRRLGDGHRVLADFLGAGSAATG